MALLEDRDHQLHHPLLLSPTYPTPVDTLSSSSPSLLSFEHPSPARRATAPMQALAPLSPSSSATHPHQQQQQQQRRSRSRTITHSLPRMDTLRLNNSSILSGPSSSPLFSFPNDAKNTSSPVTMMHHSWALATERAKRAAESELSPPISPKNEDNTQPPPPQQQEQQVNITPVNSVSTAKNYAPTATSVSRQRDNNSEATKAIAAGAAAKDNNPLPYTPSSLLSGPSALSPHPDSLPSQLLTAGIHVVGTDPSPTSATTSTTPSTAPVTHQPSPALSLGNQPHHSPKITPVPFATQLEKLAIDSSLDHRQYSHLIDTPPCSRAVSPTSPSLGIKDIPTSPSSTSSFSSSVSTSEPVQLPLPLPPSSILSHTPRTSTAPAKTTVSYGKLLHRISNEVDGRDKTIKVIQYFAKLFLWLFLADSKRYKVLAARVKALAKQFSTTRKVLRLGHFIDPLAAVLLLYKTTMMKIHEQGVVRTVMSKPKSETWRDVTRNRLGNFCTVLGFVQDIADDLYCLGSIGVLDKWWADKSEPWSIYLWMVGVTIDLHENLQSIYDARQQLKRIALDKGTESLEYEKQARKIHWLQVTTIKLGGDFMFCAYDALHCSFSDGFQAVTGLASGLAGAYKYLGKLIES